MNNLHTKTLRQQARGALKGAWWIAAGATFLAMVLGVFSSAVVSVGEVNLGGLIDNPFASLESYTPASLTQAFKALVISLRGLGIIEAVLALCALLIGSLFTLAYRFFVGGPVTVGYYRYLIGHTDGKADNNVSVLFDNLRVDYKKSVKLRFFYDLVMFLAVGPLCILAVLGFVFGNKAALDAWLAGAPIGSESVLPLVGFSILAFLMLCAALVLGTLVSLRYSYVFALAAEYPELSIRQLFKNSADLTKGHRGQLFGLDLSFLGWGLLALVTGGVSTLFVRPYRIAARLELYRTISPKEIPEDVEFPSIDPDDYIEEGEEEHRRLGGEDQPDLPEAEKEVPRKKNGRSNRSRDVGLPREGRSNTHGSSQKNNEGGAKGGKKSPKKPRRNRKKESEKEDFIYLDNI